MARAGRKRVAGIKRTPSGRASRAADNIDLDAQRAAYAVYFIASLDRVKVGYTSNLSARVTGIESNSGRAAEVLGVIRASSQRQALEIEGALHESLTAQGRHFQGEWFSIGRVDVVRLLAAARARGLSTMGGEDASMDVPIMSSLTYAAKITLPTWGLS